MNTLLSSISLLLKKSRQSLMYGSMAAATIGLEELVECVVFNCPCEGNFAYGLAFQWAPALLLFLPGILLDKTLWRKYPREKDKAKKDKTKLSRRYYKTLFTTLDVFIRASIAPVAWLVLSFLQQQYYTCAYFGPPVDRVGTVTNATDKCQFKLGARSKQLEEHYQTRSQIAGWSLMLIATSVLFSSICFRRCVKREKHLRMPSLEYYRHVEAKEALEQFHTKAKELAKEKAKREVHNLFKSVASRDIDSRVKDVGTRVEEKYHQFFAIPPESPSYGSPENTPGDPPQFPSTAEIPPELLADESEVRRFEVHNSVVGVQFSSQTAYSASKNPRQVTRIRLRQDSVDTR